MLVGGVLYCERDKKYIEQCLASLYNKVDRLIVNITDKSEYPVLDDRIEYIRTFKEDIDYGYWRNEILEQCINGDWVLMLDCDERLNQLKDYRKLASTMDTTNVYGVQLMLGQWVRMQDYSFYNASEVLRLIKVFDGRYENAIHEDISGTIAKAGKTTWKVPLTNASIDIYHLGYDIPYADRLAKVRLQEKPIWESETMPMYMKLLYTANARFMEGKYDIGLGQCIKALSLVSYEHSPKAFKELEHWVITHLYSTKKYDMLEGYLTGVEKHTPYMSWLLCIIYGERGNREAFNAVYDKIISNIDVFKHYDLEILRRMKNGFN